MPVSNRQNNSSEAPGLNRYIGQIGTLMSKNFRAVLCRNRMLVVSSALVLPILLSSFFSFAKDLFVPPAKFGIGTAHDVRTLAQAFDEASGSSRSKIVLINNGFYGGNIEAVLDAIARQASDYGPPLTISRLDREDELYTECPSTLRGVTNCYGALVMNSSPTEGHGGIWNYTIRTDAAMWESTIKINVRSSSNMEEIYLLPLQRAVDTVIASLNGNNADPLARNKEMPFTSQTQEERSRKVRELFHNKIINFMGVCFTTTVIWITYHVPGFIAAERESGISQLIDVMMPVPHPWMGPMARIVAYKLSFSAVYAPAWIVGSIILQWGIFVNTSCGIVLTFHILAGFGFTSFSIFMATFFRKARLSGIITILATLLLAVLAQSLAAPNTGLVATLSVLFPPCNYVYFITLMARFEKEHTGAGLLEPPPGSSWEIPGIVLWLLLVIQIFVYLVLAVWNERRCYGTAFKSRKMHMSRRNERSLEEHAVSLVNVTKIYEPSPLSKLCTNFGMTGEWAQPVVAVDRLSFKAARGEIVALLGANGSGKSTTLDAIAGLHQLTSGSISIDGTGGLGIAPQNNVLWDELNVEEHLTIFNSLKAPENRDSGTYITELTKAIDLFSKRKCRAKTLSGGQKHEADLLADSILILDKGTLRAEGSSAQLKTKFGGGYKVRVHKHSGSIRPPAIKGVVRTATAESTTYFAPNSKLVARAIQRLESAGINSFRLSGPTLEDVFLELAGERKKGNPILCADTRATRTLIAEQVAEGEVSTHKPGDQGIKLTEGKPIGNMKQISILFRKRITVFKTNLLLFFVALSLPIVAAAFTSLYVRGKGRTGCSASEQLSSWGTEDPFSWIENNHDISVLVGPLTRLKPSDIRGHFAPTFADLEAAGITIGSGAINNLHFVNTYAEFQQHIRDNRTNIIMGLWLGDDTNAPTVAWVANMFVSSCLMAQQTLDTLLSNTTIATAWSPFDIPLNPAIGDALKLVIYMSVALACYPALFGLYPSTERRTLVRTLQYSNGVRPFPLWTAYLIFDCITVAMASATVACLWSSLSGIWYHLEYTFVVFFLYGVAAALLAYLVSGFAKTPLATFAWAVAYQGLVFLAYLTSHLCVIAYVKVDRIDSVLLMCHFVISALAPIGSAARALFISTNLFATACDGHDISQNPGDFVIGAREDGLRVMHLTKSFGKDAAIDNVTFGVKRGEVFVLLGPNGAGKSTTLSLIRGDLKPDYNGGDVFIEGGSMTVREHLEFYARVRGVSDVEHNVSAILRMVDLEEFESRLGHLLSGGNKRKLSLGITMVGNPAVVLLDEPSSGLDATSRRILWTILAEAANQRSVLLTTHNMEEAEALASRVGILACRMLALGPLDDLRHQFGDTLHVHLVSVSAPRTPDAEMQHIATWIAKYIPSAALETETYHGQVRFSVSVKDVSAASSNSGHQPPAKVPEGRNEEIQSTDLPTANMSGAIGRLVVLLEEHKASLGVQYYSVSPATLDELFLTVVGRHQRSQ
ncbi:hypothetical protein PLICBS_003856 [Purpureocillium lilacinum]|uniref:uncharacterized protein n=1 Tax=Purpureocillium lilacinum TaxID=33203 RepID=UPI0020849C1B|nr:hypothetical protein PLICBS_003856 [Purpureocillium lilacinum]